MKPFKLTMTLDSGIQLFEHPVAFDALLMCILTDKFRGDAQRASEELSCILKSTDGIFHASLLHFGVNNANGLIASQSSLTRKSTDSDFEPWLIQGNEKNGTFPKIKTDGGETKNKLQIVKTLVAPKVIFYAHGDVDKIKILLDMHLIGLGANSRRMGFGNVSDFIFEEIDIDRSLLNERGLPARRLPYNLYQNLKGGTGDLKPRPVRCSFPYYLANEEDGVSPPRIITEIITEELY